MLFVFFAYILSSVPFGLVVSKLFFKKDIRELGSKNIGATNVYRNFGKLAGISVLILDGLKGLLPCIFYGRGDLLALVSFAAIVGHVFPIFLMFKGGKGVATAFCVLIYLNYIAFFVSILVFCIVLLVFRYVSLASICAFASVAIFACFISSISFLSFALATFALVTFRHKENIKRLLAFREKKIF